MQPHVSRRITCISVAAFLEPFSSFFSFFGCWAGCNRLNVIDNPQTVGAQLHPRADRLVASSSLKHCIWSKCASFSVPANLGTAGAACGRHAINAHRIAAINVPCPANLGWRSICWQRARRRHPYTHPVDFAVEFTAQGDLRALDLRRTSPALA